MVSYPTCLTVLFIASLTRSSNPNLLFWLKPKRHILARIKGSTTYDSSKTHRRTRKVRKQFRFIQIYSFISYLNYYLLSYCYEEVRSISYPPADVCLGGGFEIDVSAAAIMKRFEQISDEDLNKK